MKVSQKESIIEAFEQMGQGHVFDGFEFLSNEKQIALLQQAGGIDLARMERLLKESVEQKVSDEYLKPVESLQLPRTEIERELWKKAFFRGEEVIRAGRVAAFVVAGGQGTRLGFSGPKGTFVVTPLSHKSLFQVFAEKLLSAQKCYGVVIPWFIMTSEDNHDQTVEFFKLHDQFGLQEVHLFKQGQIPAVDFAGKFILDEQKLLVMSPDGHGGSFRALVNSGAIKRITEMGIDVISYFQVDNPFVSCIDSTFIGFHVDAGSEMSSKMVKKVDPEEKVGLFCKENEVLKVVEYSSASEALMNERNSEGDLVFNAGNIAVHLLDRQFAERMGTSFDFPCHRAEKRIQTLKGNVDSLDSAPNAIKFEQLIFDALAFSKNSVVMEVAREEEFSPVKNAEGKDSLQTCIKDQLCQYARWLNRVGVEIPCDEEGVPEFVFEVSPLFADNEDAFVEKWNLLSNKPEVKEGTYIE